MDCIVIFGIQGSGKGVQAKLLSAHLSYQHIMIGDLLREQILLKTQIGKKVERVIGGGGLADDDLIYELISHSLCDTAAGIVFDGFPRTPTQAEHLCANFTVQKAFYLELDDATAISRIESRRVCSRCGEIYNLISKKPQVEGVCDVCGSALIIRDDDKPSAIRKRIKDFHERTQGLTEFFAEKGLLATIPAAGTPEEVFAALLSQLG